MIVKVLKVFLEAVRLIAEAVRVTVSIEIACRISMKGKVKAVRVLAEAVGVIKEANKKISDAVKLFVEAVRRLAESL
jgi:hypothetical protein